FIAVVDAGMVGAEFVPDQIRRHLAALVAPANAAILQAVGRRGEETIVPAIERMQGRKRRLERVAAIAAGHFPAYFQTVSPPDETRLEQGIARADHAAAMRIATLVGQFGRERPTQRSDVVVRGEITGGDIAQTQVAVRRERQAAVFDEIAVAGEGSRPERMRDAQQMRVELPARQVGVAIVGAKHALHATEPAVTQAESIGETM